MTATTDMFRPKTVEEVASLVKAGTRWLPVGAGTKPTPASPPAGYTAFSLTALRGIVEYEPGEYTFTARAGTPISEIAAELARHGQYLPFDPLLAEAGATLGGSIAAGLSGPGRLRYGGIRDFILGVQFVTGAGEVARGGGKVVKNAAGFDFPKLLVGSLGRLSSLVEAIVQSLPPPGRHRHIAGGRSGFCRRLHEHDGPGRGPVRLGRIGIGTAGAALVALERFAGHSGRSAGPIGAIGRRPIGAPGRGERLIFLADPALDSSSGRRPPGKSANDTLRPARARTNAGGLGGRQALFGSGKCGLDCPGRRGGRNRSGVEGERASPVWSCRARRPAR